MTTSKNTDPIRETAIAALEAARALDTALSATTINFGANAERVNALRAALREGTLYDEIAGSGLDTLRTRVLNELSERVPGYRGIALTCNTDDYPFEDPAIEEIRALWEKIGHLARLRQRVLDDLTAERQLSTLRRGAPEAAAS